MTLALGSAAPAAAGTLRTGLYLPTGALTPWQTKRNASGTTAVEVVCFGDSTTWGQTASGASRSYTQQLRTLALAAGYADGGRGVVLYNDTTDLSAPDAFVAEQARTGTWTMTGNGPFPPSWQTTTAGSTLTIRGKGTVLRMQFQDVSAVGSWSYSVNGGSSVTVNPQAGSNYKTTPVLVTGLPGGGATNTVTVTYPGTAGLVISFEWLNATGIVFHNHGTQGIKSTSIFPTDPTAANAAYCGNALGLASIQNTACVLAAAGGAGYRNVGAAIYMIGINDAGTTSSGTVTADVQAITGSIANFAETCRAANATPIVVNPWLAIGTGSVYTGLFREAIASTGRAHDCIVVDGQTVIGSPQAAVTAAYAGSLTNDHLLAAGYNQLASYLWTNVLAV